MSVPEQSRAPESAGVIHDIGFRHYDGPRLGRREVVRALFVESARGAYGLGRSTRSKIMPFLLLAVVMLPALIVGVILNVTGGDELGIGYAEYPLNVLPLLSLYVAGQAPALVSRDLRFRVVSLYFSRPLRREDYVRAKLAALTCALAVFTCLPVLVLYAAALLAELPFWTQTREAAVALLGCLVLSVLLAGIALVVAAMTPRRGLGVAAVITVLVMSTAVQGILQVLGQEQGNASLENWSGLLSPFTLVSGLQLWAFDAPLQDVPDPPGVAGGWVYLAVTLLVAAGSYALLVMRYRRVSVS